MGSSERPRPSPPGSDSVLIALGSSVAAADVHVLCARLELVLLANHPQVVECDASRLIDPDLVAVDALARMALVCLRTGRRLRVRRAGKRLTELLVLAGLADVLPCLPD